MSAGAAGASGAAAAAAAIAQAIKASGAIVRVEPNDFIEIIYRCEAPLVVHHRGGFFNRGHHYLTSYKGLAFYTRHADALELPADSELIEAGKIWMPS